MQCVCFVNVICRYKKKSKELRQHYIECVSSEAVDGEVNARQVNPDPTDAAAGGPTPAVSFRSEWLNLVEAACRKCSTESDLDDAMKVTFVLRLQFSTFVTSRLRDSRAERLQLKDWRCQSKTKPVLRTK